MNPFPDCVVDRTQPRHRDSLIRPAIARAHFAGGARGFVGEHGVPGDDPRWPTVMDRFLAHLDENCVGAAYWAGGPWWPDDYLSLIEPLPGLKDQPQITVLQDHPSFECTRE